MSAPSFAATLLLTLSAMTLPAPPDATRATPAAPCQVGRMQVWTLRDGQISLEASLLQGLDLAEARRMLGGKEAASTPVNAFLVRLAGQTVLVDTGIGKDPEEDSGHLLAQLAAAGVKASEVDLILITHYHFDHIGGLLNADGTRAFPKALLRVPRREHAFWLQEPSTLPERLRGRIPKLKAIFSAYESAGAFRTFEVGETLGAGIRAWAAPEQTGGHTGGHTVYAFTSEGQELWCIGDLIHFGAVQFERPEVGISFDLDGARAVRIRQEIFQRAAQSKAVLAGAHLPELVQIEAKGVGYRARPVSHP